MLTPILLALQVAVPAAPDTPVYNGRQNQTTVTVPKRPNADIKVDGVLSEPEWAQAALLTGFSQYSPVDGAPAEDSTEVVVWYTDHALYIGVRAFEPHGAVQATLAERDRILADDHIYFLIDAFADRRRALVFAVNPLGVQADGVIDEARQQQNRPGERRSLFDEKVDSNPDYLFASKGRLTDWGYEVELRLPFKSLRYPTARVQDWGFNVVRSVQHSAQEQTWTAARRGQASFLAQSGTLQRLTELKRGLVLELNPVATAHREGTLRTRPVQEYTYTEVRPEFSGNARWGITPNLTMNATVNPDFSQVEADVAQVTFDPRQSLFFPEKRPFFLDAIEEFNVPNLVIYTRRIVAPEAAAKFTGKIGSTSVGFLSAVDGEEFSATREDRPLYNVLRLRRDLGRQSQLGAVYTDRLEGDDYNRVAGLDGRVIFERQYTLSAQLVGSFWRSGDEVETVPLWDIAFDRNGRRFGFTSHVKGIHDDVRLGAGFTSRTGIVNQVFRPRLTFYGQRSSLVQNYTTSLTFDNTWDYQEFEEGIGPDDIKLHWGNQFNLRGGWNLGATFVLETFRYPEQYYGNYYVQRLQPDGSVRDTVAFVGRRRIPNYDLFITAATPQFPKFSANGYVIVGRDENFDEWAPGWIFFTQVSTNYRPTEQLRVNLRYNEQRTMRVSDRSVVRLSRIPRLKVEYQITRPLFARVVAQYVAEERDQLRDDAKTGFPLLICNAPLTSCTRGSFERQNLRGDILLAYQPNPGTVLYAGYGSSMRDTRAFRFGRGEDQLTRTADGFFVKLSYLFRL